MIRLAIRVRPEAAELALARLAPVLGAGAEEVERDGAVEYALYGAPEALPTAARLRELAGDALLGVAHEPVAPGWETAYHAHVPRTEVGRLAVRPPWVPGGDEDLVVDPGTAFGAGTHATTRLCLALLQEVAPGGALCDWGTGTGVLAIAAARLGWSPVHAVDVADVELARANVAANAAAVEVRALDVAREAAPPADTVVANLTLPLLRAAAAIQPRPERLIASGVLAGEVGALAAAWAPLTVVERRVEAGWAGVVLA